MNENEMIAHWGNCERCGVVVIYAQHADMSGHWLEAFQEGPGGEWERFSDCQLCDGTILWGGSDPLPFTIRG